MIFAAKKKTDGPKHFRRLCDKKINVLAMAAILNVPDAALPAEVSAGLGQLMAGLMKLLTTLKAQQVRMAVSPGGAETARTCLSAAYCRKGPYTVLQFSKHKHQTLVTPLLAFRSSS